jgi:RNA polymerase sigma-70 factor (ECF subfamily)
LLLANTLTWQPAAQEICLPHPDEPAKPITEAHAVAGASEDLQLAEACRSGNAAAYEKLYQAHGPRLKSIALNLLGNRTDAEDAVQEVFLKVYRGIGSFRGQSSFSTWIYRILLNSCYDMRRRKLRRQETPEPVREGEGETPLEIPGPVHDHPMRLVLETCVAQLKQNQREVFLLFEVEGFRHSEIAGMLNISETSSKNILYQAKRQLRRLLTESGKQT